MNFSKNSVQRYHVWASMAAETNNIPRYNNSIKLYPRAKKHDKIEGKGKRCGFEVEYNSLIKQKMITFVCKMDLIMKLYFINPLG